MDKNLEQVNEVAVIVEDDIFIYPFMITPLFLNDEANLSALELSLEEKNKVLVVSSLPDKEGERNLDNVFDYGVIGNIMRKVVLPDGRVKILFQGEYKAQIIDEISSKPLKVKTQEIQINMPDSSKTSALIAVLREKVKELANISHYFSPDLIKTIEDSYDAIRICDLILSSLGLKKEMAYSFFIQNDLEQKILRLIEYIIDEINAIKLQKEIKKRVHSKIDKNNKEYFLKEQLRQIQKELGGDNNKEEEINEYNKKLELKKKFMPEDGYKEIKKQIQKLSRIHPDSADANTIISYLDWVLEIPFENLAKEKSSILEVAQQLNNDHYGLKKPKERIEEYFALRELLESRNSKSNNGAILCFVGPPGVGKTSLANSIAKALKRELIRVALGGLEDVNELRGHRRTYIGSMPGRIVQGLIEAKQINPVIVLDEIDKIGRNYRGDPSAVLLEILDPEQNNKFRDYYLNFNIDLSKVIFIATANDISQIAPPLRDRMEFIELSSYTPQEKFEIVKTYLLPQELKKHGLKENEAIFTDDAVQNLISDYTRESGVRNLRRKIADILRKIAKKILLKENETIEINKDNLKDYLDKKVFEIEKSDKEGKLGQVNGLAWTSVGGDVLHIEAIKIKGKGNIKITGQLGDVMKESAHIAFSVVKVLLDEKILPSEKSEIYKNFDLHLHVPEGATPKDGPSAGITMATAIASILTGKKVLGDIAMTGEITLTGKVLAIGGLKEKLIAAHKAGIKKALIPSKNFKRDLKDIPDEVKNDLEIIAVDDIKEVLNQAFVK